MDPNEDKGFINMADKTERKKLEKSVSIRKGQVGKYYYGIVSFMRPVRLHATIPLLNGQTVYTKAGEERNEATCGKYTFVTANQLAGPAERTALTLNNGGTWFKFMQPLDLAEFTGEVKVMLAYNLDSIINAKYTSRCGYVRDANYLSVTVPFMEFLPVVYQAGEKITKETYAIVLPSPYNVTVRLELYFGDKTPDVVRAVDGKEIYTSVSPSDPMPWGKTFSITSDADGLNFNEFDGRTVLGKLKRTASGTAKFYCYNLMEMGGACPTGIDVTYTRTSVVMIN
jgi:hypothetical protein